MKHAALCVALVSLVLIVSGAAPARAAEYRVGTWKTAQTIQPFFYGDFLQQGDTATIFTFTNPADQKTAAGPSGPAALPFRGCAVSFLLKGETGTRELAI